MKKNAKGKEFSVSISPSNVYITDLNLEDKFRAQRLKLSDQAPKAKPEPKAEPKTKLRRQKGQRRRSSRRYKSDIHGRKRKQQISEKAQFAGVLRHPQEGEGLHNEAQRRQAQPPRGA
jgi:hypothetical protein